MTPPPREVCIFGGSFNPPHVCHVLASTWAVSSLPIDAVWWVPTFEHAFGKGLLAFDHRVTLCELATRPFADTLRVSRIEEEMGGRSYTIDTLTELRARHPDTNFSLLIGTDILAETHRWKAWDEIEATTQIHILGRETRGDEAVEGISLPNVSSTAIRAALARGDHAFCAPRVPRAVLAHIEQHGWYAEPSDA